MDTLTLLLLSELGLAAAVLGPMYYSAGMMRSGRFRQALPILLAYYTASRLLPRWRGPMAGFLCACYVGMGEFALAQPYAEEAIRENESRGFAQHLATARAHLGVILVRQGDFEQAGVLFNETLSLPMPPRLRPTVELFAANGYINMDQLDEAEKLLEKVLRSARPDTDVAIVALSNRSLCSLYRGHPADALDWARRAAKPKAPTQNIEVAVLTSLLLCLTEAGHLQEAQEVASRLAPLLPTLDEFRRGAGQRALAELALKQGDLDRARDYAERATTPVLNPNAQANTLLILAEVYAARHNHYRALTLCRDILQLRAVHYYKQRALALADRLESKPAVTASAISDYTVSEAAPPDEVPQQILFNNL